MRRIIWSPEALEDYERNIEYLLNNWSVKEAQAFIDEVAEVLHLLQRTSVKFRLTGFKDIRVVTVCHQINLFYRINKTNDIELVRFWDNRQNPERLQKSLE